MKIKLILLSIILLNKLYLANQVYIFTNKYDISLLSIKKYIYIKNKDKNKNKLFLENLNNYCFEKEIEKKFKNLNKFEKIRDLKLIEDINKIEDPYLKYIFLNGYSILNEDFKKFVLTKIKNQYWIDDKKKDHSQWILLDDLYKKISSKQIVETIILK